MIGTSFVLDLRGENEFEPYPQNKILVHFGHGIPFKITDDQPRHFHMEVPSPIIVNTHFSSAK